jgi:hypothetical protein
MVRQLLSRRLETAVLRLPLHISAAPFV